MSEQGTFDRIEELVDEEHRLWAQASEGKLDQEGHRRLEEIRGQLDQLWQTLRRRRANPGAADVIDHVPDPPNDLDGPEPEPPHLEHGVHGENEPDPDPDVPRDIP
jgi:hypothetical protein